jgi:phage tail sheath protein FI
MAFFRGIESKYTTQQVGMREVPEAVIGVVGTAPIHHCPEADRSINAIKIINSDTLGRQLFGPDIDGYTVPMAVTINSLESGPLMLAINVFDPDVHFTAVAATPVTLNAMGRAQLATRDWISATLTNADASVTYVEGTDYTFDKVTGLLKRLPTATFLPGAPLKISGKIGDPSKVTAADIVGAVSVAGFRTGIQLWRNAFQQLGFFATDLVAPTYEALPSVRVALEAIANETLAIAHCQMPAGLTVQDALSSRGPSGPANFQVSSDRVKIFMPYYKSPRADSTPRLVPLSLGYASVFGRTIMDEGFWHTGSNKPLRSAIGLERPITFGSETDDANLLNAAGISTVRSNWGSSIHTWGPSTSAFPDLTDPVHFDCIRRFYDVVDRRIALTLLQYIDRPLTPALVEIIVGEINDFYATLINKGALVAGLCRYDPSDNPAEELAQGHFTTRDDLSPPAPFQRFTRKYRYDRNALVAAFAAA